MASENGNQTTSVVLLSDMQQHPHRYGFFQAVRKINCSFKDMPLTGFAFRPGDDAVRFAQSPHTQFAPATIESIDQNGPNGAPVMTQYFLGLFGPDGPLPLHVTEYVRDRQRHHQDSTFVGFSNMFHHRIVSLFYRAWAEAQPTVQRDRPDKDRFTTYVGALVGLGLPAFKNADAMPLTSKLHYAGHMASLPRHAAGLASILESYLKVPAKVVEFIAHWLTIPRRDRFRLGSNPGLGRLGTDAVLGEKVWQRQDKFQICFGPMTLDQYESLLPTGIYFKSMVAAVRNYLGLELLWETRLLLKGSEKPVTCLGKQGALGWTSWLRSDHHTDEVGDLVLQASSYPVE